MKHPDQVKADEMLRRAAKHTEMADQYAEASHEWRGELGDAYSAASEAHRSLAVALRNKAAYFEESARASD